MRLVLVPITLLLACGPRSADDTGAATTDVATTDVATTDAATTTPTTGEPPLVLTPDEQLCVDHCGQWQTACPWFDASCFGDCLANLEYTDAGPCGPERRAVMACEAQHPLDETCQAIDCTDVYLQESLCDGDCWHFDPGPSSGASQEDCDWQVTGCYGHDLAMRCLLGDAPQCTCTIDGAEVGTCTLGMPLGAFSCGGEDFGIFSGCCTDLFLEAIP